MNPLQAQKKKGDVSSQENSHLYSHTADCWEKGLKWFSWDAILAVNARIQSLTGFKRKSLRNVAPPQSSVTVLYFTLNTCLFSSL
jgi:hypothetical protein